MAMHRAGAISLYKSEKILPLYWASQLLVHGTERASKLGLTEPNEASHPITELVLVD
jgi:hypothetical protein